MGTLRIAVRAAPAGIVAAAGLLAAAAGCNGGVRSRTAEKFEPSPTNVTDADNPADAQSVLDSAELKRAADRIKVSRKPPVPPERTYNVLVISGGGIYGAYPAGLLTGWTGRGRPDFDVCTGISTGALIAAVAFLGTDYDPLLCKLYTTVTDADIYRRRPPIRSLLADSLVDNTPYVTELRATVDDKFLRGVAAEHAKGRRLYVGTTNLPTRRLVVWDMGAIATRYLQPGCGPAAEALFEDILLASSAIPGFFSPVKLPVDVDGKQYTELHVDGGVSRALFFRPPYVEPSKREGFGPTSLYGSNLYVMVAGKVYADPEPVRARSLAVAGNAITSVIYSQTRGDLDRLFNYCVLTGMNYHMAAIPAEFKVTTQNTKFDPVEMGRMFAEGKQQIAAGTAFADRPPALDRTEELRARTGLRLTAPGDDKTPEQPVGPESPGPAGNGREAIPIPALPLGRQ